MMKKFLVLVVIAAAFVSCENEIPEVQENVVISRVITEEEEEKDYGDFNGTKLQRWPGESAESWMRRCRKAAEDKIKEASKNQEG